MYHLSIVYAGHFLLQVRFLVSAISIHTYYYEHFMNSGFFSGARDDDQTSP